MRRRVRFVPLAAAAIVFIALLVVAIDSAGARRSSPRGAAELQAKVKEGGFLRIGTVQSIDTLNLWNSVTFITGPFLDTCCYPELLQYDKTLHYKPDLAASYKVAKNGRDWTFKIKPGLKWSDGQPLTADDIVWTFNTVKKFGADATSIWAYGDAFLGAKKVDATTVVLSFDKPQAGAIDFFQYMPILPKHVWGTHTGNNGKDLQAYNVDPSNPPSLVSGGPFVISGYKKDEITLFKRNPYFYGPKPHIAGMGLKLYANNDALVTALKSGEVDAIGNVPGTAVGTLKSSGFMVKSTPGFPVVNLVINSNYHGKATNPELFDGRLRLAFDYAIDRKTIVNVVYQGFATAAGGIFSKQQAAWDKKLTPLPLNLAKANAILDSLGYSRGPGGIRVANGHPMSYTVLVNSRIPDRLFQIMQQDFQKIGVGLNERVLDFNAWKAAVLDSNYTKFDLAISTWSFGASPDAKTQQFVCSSLGTTNDSGYCNPKYDALFKQEQSELNPQKRLAIIRKMAHIIHDGRFWLPIVNTNVIDAWNKKWTGFVATPQGVFNYLSKDTFVNVQQR